MSRLSAASLAHCSSLVTTRLSASHLRLTKRWYEQSWRQLCSQPSKQTTPNVSALYKALTKPFPSDAPDPKLTSLLQAAQHSHDPHAAVKVLKDHVTTTAIHQTHVSTAVQLCLPDTPQLAVSLLATLESSLPRRTLTPGRSFLARYYTSQNEPEKALDTMGFPKELLSSPAVNVHTEFDCDDLGVKPSAWGVIVKGLTQLKYTAHACEVADMAMRRRVRVTDGFLHLFIDALRLEGRWEEASSLFDGATERGVIPSERTVGSLILALSSRSARAKVERRRVIEIVDMVQTPSVRFLETSLSGLTSVGAILRAERVFMELMSDGIVQEEFFAKMIAGLGNFVELLAANEVDNVDESTYCGISERSSELWGDYLRRFPHGRDLSGVLSKVLRVKTRCFRYGEGVDILEKLVEDRRGYAVDITHITGILGAVELASDVRALGRLLKVMDTLGLKHDMRSLAFCVGTLIGDGNLAEAVAMVRQEGKVVTQDSGSGFKKYYPVLLLRRLRTLSQALQEGGVGQVDDVEWMIDAMAQQTKR